MRSRIPVLALLALSVFGLADTCGPTGATITGITPAEVLLPSDKIFVKGWFGSGTRVIQLIDPSNPGASLPTPAVVSDPSNGTSSIRISIPNFSTSRKQYQIKVTIDGQSAVRVPNKSDRLYMRSSGSAPTAQTIQVVYVNWGWTFFCANGSCDCNDGGGGFFPKGWDPLLINDDSWNGVSWRDWRRFQDQTSRDWATICSPTWNNGGLSFLDGIEEAVTRDSFAWNKHFWFNADFDSPEISALARGKIVANSGGNPTEISLSSLGAGIAINQSNRIVVHGVGAFVTNCLNPTANSFNRSCEIVNPNSFTTGFRGISPAAASDGTNPTGMVVVTDLQSTTQRPHPSSNANRCLGALIQPAALTGWWGTSETADATPNLLSHELAHVLTGLPNPTSDAATPDRVLVENPVSSWRGFLLDVPNVPGAGAPPSTITENCLIAVIGRDARDFTQ